MDCFECSTSNHPSSSEKIDEDAFQPRPAKRRRKHAVKKKMTQNTRKFSQGTSKDVLPDENVLIKGLARHDPEVITRFIVCLVVLANLPLSVVEHHVFQSFLKLLVPWYDLPSRKTLTKRVDDAYEAAKAHVIKKAANQSFFSMTFDMATLMNTSKHYIVITLHYYDQIACTFHSFVLGARQLLNRSTADEIGEQVKSALKDFGVELSKIGAVCTDGGSNALKACKDIFGVTKHVACCCHILDNSVKESIAATADLPNLISVLKRIVQYFKQSYCAANELRSLQVKIHKIKISNTLMLIQSVPTRWNSTLISMQRFVQLFPLVKKVLIKLQTKATDSSRQNLPPDLKSELLDSMKSVIPLLTGFQDFSKKFSSNNAPVSGTAILDIQFLQLRLENLEVTDPTAVMLRDNLIKEISKRFVSTCSSTLLSAANLLDPRFKGSGLTREAHAKGGKYIKDLLRQRSIAIPRLGKNSDDSSNLNLEKNISILALFSKISHGRLVRPVQEIDDFLDCPRTTLEKCPLQWWRDNKDTYPHLSTVALEVLTIPVSSVASERTVSALNRIVSNKRARLSMENVNKLVVLISMPIDFWRDYVNDRFVYYKEREM